MKRHIGGIILSDKVVMDALGFHGGYLIYAAMSEERLGIRFNIEHPDMPELLEEAMIPIVNVAYFRPAVPGDIMLLPSRKLYRRLKDSVKAAISSFRIVWKE